MSYLYALTDSHGCQEVFARALDELDLTGSNHLYLLGDYIPHQTRDMEFAQYLVQSARALSYVRRFAEEHVPHVTVLAGNHERYLLLLEEVGQVQMSDELLAWLQALPLYAETKDQIFVHAGVEEEAGRAWRYGDEDVFCQKFPPTFGKFYKDVVAGHVGVSGASFANDPTFQRVFWDGESHYYLDASTEHTGTMAILRFDTERRAYSQKVVHADDATAWMPVTPFA